MQATVCWLTQGINGRACSLGSNQIGDAGAATIGEALKTNAALTKLECVESN